MFSSRSKTGRNNVIGLTIARHRKELHISQRELADWPLTRMQFSVLNQVSVLLQTLRCFILRRSLTSH